MKNQITLTENNLIITEDVDNLRTPSIFDGSDDNDNWDLLPKFSYEDIFIESKVQSFSENNTWKNRENKDNSWNYVKSTLDSSSWKGESYAFDFSNKSSDKQIDQIYEDQLQKESSHCILSSKNKNLKLSKQSCFSNSDFYEHYNKMEESNSLIQRSDFQNEFDNSDVNSLNNWNLSDLWIADYINNVIENGMKWLKTKPGRPKHTFDTSYSTITRFFENYVESLQSLIESNYSMKRSDTFRFTIFSYLKKLPIKLREIWCSVSDPKSKWFDVYLDAFLSPFVNCFLPFFNDKEVNCSKLELFLHFIWIWFPEDKCLQVLEKINLEGPLEKLVIDKIKINLQLRKGKSKKDITAFITNNQWFRIYSSHLLRMIDSSNFEDLASLMINDFIVDI